jgi:hypothetical protein
LFFFEQKIGQHEKLYNFTELLAQFVSYPATGVDSVEVSRRIAQSSIDNFTSNNFLFSNSQYIFQLMWYVLFSEFFLIGMTKNILSWPTHSFNHLNGHKFWKSKIFVFFFLNNYICCAFQSERRGSNLINRNIIKKLKSLSFYSVNLKKLGIWKVETQVWMRNFTFPQKKAWTAGAVLGQWIGSWQRDIFMSTRVSNGHKGMLVEFFWVTVHFVSDKLCNHTYTHLVLLCFF